MSSEPAKRAVNLDLFAPTIDRDRPRAGKSPHGTTKARKSKKVSKAPPAPKPDPLPRLEAITPDRPGAEGSFFGRPFREFEFSGGIHLTDSVLWCDAERKKELSFISSAHADVLGKNRRILATEQTVKILTRATGRIDALTSPFRRSFTLGPLELEMHPSGRMLGSAQLLVVRDGRRILYTNDFLTQRLATAERAQPIACDVLALPTTFGRPDQLFPPRDEVFEDIRAFVDTALEEKATPVLVVPPLGAAQELMYLLGKRGYRLRAHRSIFDVAKVYLQMGVNLLNSKRLQGPPARDEVVLVPPILRHSAPVRKIKNPRTALISGRAVDPGHVFRARVDAAYAFGEAADYEELIAFVEGCDPAEVYVTAGYTEEIAEALRDRGRRVIPLVEPQQLPLF